MKVKDSIIQTTTTSTKLGITKIKGLYHFCAFKVSHFSSFRWKIIDPHQHHKGNEVNKIVTSSPLRLLPMFPFVSFYWSFIQTWLTYYPLLEFWLYKINLPSTLGSVPPPLMRVKFFLDFWMIHQKFMFTLEYFIMILVIFIFR